MEITLLLRAEADALRIYARYEDLHFGRGELFVAALERSLNQLREFPESAPVLASSDIVATGDLSFDAVSGTGQYVILKFRPKELHKSTVRKERQIKIRFFDRSEKHAEIIQRLNRFTEKPALVALVRVDEQAVEGFYLAGDLKDSVRDPDPALERAIKREVKFQDKIAHDFVRDPDLPHYEVVKNLLYSIKDPDSQQIAFTKLESLGEDGVPAIIAHMDDFRDLPHHRMSLKNPPGHWEGVRHYGPEKVVDALAAILNQLTEHSYRSTIYSGGSDHERRACIDAWRVHLHHTENEEQNPKDSYGLAP